MLCCILPRRNAICSLQPGTAHAALWHMLRKKVHVGTKVQKYKLQHTLTAGSPSSNSFECWSHSAACRMSASRMRPLLLLYANRLQCCGWKSAHVMTCRQQSSGGSVHQACFSSGRRQARELRAASVQQTQWDDETAMQGSHGSGRCKCIANDTTRQQPPATTTTTTVVHIRQEAASWLHH